MLLKATDSVTLFFVPLPFQDHSPPKELSFSQLFHVSGGEPPPPAVTALTGTYFDRSLSSRSLSRGRQQSPKHTNFQNAPIPFPSFPRKEGAACLPTENPPGTRQLGGKGRGATHPPSRPGCIGERLRAVAQSRPSRRGDSGAARAGLRPGPAAGPRAVGRGEAGRAGGQPPPASFPQPASAAHFGASPRRYSPRETPRSGTDTPRPQKRHESDFPLPGAGPGPPPRAPLLRGRASRRQR